MPPLRRVLLSRAWLAAIGYALFAYGFHTVGNQLGFYVQYWWFQIAAHYVSASAVALVLARTGLDMGLRGRRLVAFVVGFSFLGAIGWEVVEYLAIFENLHFWGIEDSLMDLAADAVGVASVLALLGTRLRPVIDPTVETPVPSSPIGDSRSG